MTDSKYPKGFFAFIVTESLGAFNDNFFKMVLQLHILSATAAAHAEEHIAKLAIAFTAPFVLFGPWSGYFSDKYPKSRVIKIVKALEIAILICGTVILHYGRIDLMALILFLLATHSAFFAPAKAGFIPEACPGELISKANGVVGMSTFLSIIFGTAVAGVLMKWHGNAADVVAAYGIGIACLGTATAFFVTPTRSRSRALKFPRNPLRGVLRDLKFLKGRKGLFLASLAHSYFWLLGLILQTNILIYGRKHLGLAETDTIALSVLPAVLGIGIAAGSLLAGRWSGRKVEIGLVPLGGAGITAACIALFFSAGHYNATVAILFFAGLFGGLFIIPLYSYIQYEAPETEKGRVLSTVGVMNGLFLVLGSLLYDLLAVRLHITPAGISLFMGIFSFFVTLYICTVIPEYFARFLNWLLTHTFYSIKVHGSENVPLHGPVLLVPNHVSFIDAMLIGATVQRFIKFIMWKKIYDIPVVKQICKVMDVIPIAPYEGRASVTKSLETGRERLLSGEAVCIFAEGGITRDGELHEFKGGMESIMRGVTCPIVPVYLHNVWGSIFSFESGKVFWKWPKRLPYRVSVYFGEPMPPDSSARSVEAAVRRMAESVAAAR